MSGNNIPRAQDVVTDTCVGHSRRKYSVVSAVARVARRVWRGKKVALELSGRAQVDPRTCERWLSLRTGISSDALVDILRSDAGLHFLEELMGDYRPEWWRGFKRAAQIEELRKRQDEQAALLERLEREAAE